MKNIKIKLIGFATLLFVAIAIFVSCNKNDKICTTCKETGYVLTQNNILNHVYSFKSFKTVKNDKISNFKYVDQDLSDIKNMLFSEINILQSVITSKNDIATISLFENEKSEKFSLKNTDLILLFVRKAENFETIVLEKNANFEYVINDKLKLTTNYIASNDICRLSKLITNNSKYNCFTFLESKNCTPFSLIKSTFQKKLSTIKKEKSTAQVGPDDDIDACQEPCPIGKFGTCIVTGHGGMGEPDGGGSWTCSILFPGGGEGGGGCIGLKVGYKLRDSIGYPSDPLLNPSYLFRDNFLKNNTKGEVYIDYYYTISQMMINELDIDFSILIYNTVINELLPICNALLNNPTSNDVLINDNVFDVFNNKLEFLRTKLNNSEADLIIDNLKQDLIFYKGKSINFVYNDFKN